MDSIDFVFHITGTVVWSLSARNVTLTSNWLEAEYLWQWQSLRWMLLQLSKLFIFDTIMALVKLWFKEKYPGNECKLMY